jgi:hypothetical protein
VRCEEKARFHSTVLIMRMVALTGNERVDIEREGAPLLSQHASRASTRISYPNTPQSEDMMRSCLRESRASTCTQTGDGKCFRWTGVRFKRIRLQLTRTEGCARNQNEITSVAFVKANIHCIRHNICNTGWQSRHSSLLKRGYVHLPSCSTASRPAVIFPVNPSMGHLKAPCPCLRFCL